MGDVTMKPLPKDSPVMIAWGRYQQTEAYANTRKWALHQNGVDGSLWEAFTAGYAAAERGLIDDEPDPLTEGYPTGTAGGERKPEPHADDEARVDEDKPAWAKSMDAKIERHEASFHNPDEVPASREIERRLHELKITFQEELDMVRLPLRRDIDSIDGQLNTIERRLAEADNERALLQSRSYEANKRLDAIEAKPAPDAEPVAHPLTGWECNGCGWWYSDVDMHVLGPCRCGVRSWTYRDPNSKSSVAHRGEGLPTFIRKPKEETPDE